MSTTGQEAAEYKVAEAFIMMVLGFRLELVDEGQTLRVLFDAPVGFQPKALEWGVGITLHLHSDHGTTYLLQGRLRHVFSPPGSTFNIYRVELTDETVFAFPFLKIGSDGRVRNVSHIELCTAQLRPGRRIDDHAFVAVEHQPLASFS